jgi:hypothetical protein
MLSLADQIELDILDQTGDVEQAQAVGHVVRETLAELTDMMAALLGLGPVFTAELAARLL